MPLVSVIIPTYNRAAYLPATIDSVLGQTFRDFELLIVDDGSTDDTRAVLRQYGERVTYLYQPNQREGASRNLGIRHSTGELLAFLDSDDVWLPWKLEMDVAALRAAPAAGLVYSRVECISSRGERLGPRRLPTPEGDVLGRLARQNFIPLSTVVARRSSFEAVGLFNPDPTLSGCMDWEAWTRLAAAYPVVHVPRVTTLLRVHGRNMQNDGSYMERSVLRAVELMLGHPQVRARLTGREKEILARACLAIAVNHCSNGATSRSRHFLRQAARQWPRAACDPRWSTTLLKSLLGAGLIARLQRGKAELTMQAARRRGAA